MRAAHNDRVSAALPRFADATAVALGRHALALVARKLRDQGISRIALPAFHCATMALPFQMEGMHIARVPVGPDLMADPRALEQTLADRGACDPHWAVLHCELFGAPGSPELRDVLRRARTRGDVLVLDTTHSWPEPPSTPADFEVAAIRKLLNLPDGALVWGLSEDDPRPSPRSPLDREETRLWMSGELDAAEDVMDQELVPVELSDESRKLVADLDLDVFLRERREAVRRLHDGLASLGLELASPRDGHFCVSMRHPAGRALVLELAHAGVDGPVWWPKPRGWRGPWPDDLVSLPTTGGRTGVDRVLGQVRDALVRVGASSAPDS